MRIRIEGTVRVINGLNDSFDDVTAVMRSAAEAAGYVIERRAKLPPCPVDTGRYRASIGHWTGNLEKPNPDASPGDASWEVIRKTAGWDLEFGSNVDYAEDLEKRTGNLGSALEEGAEEAINAYEAQIRMAVR